MKPQYRYGQLLIAGTGDRRVTNSRTFKDYLTDAISRCNACRGVGKRKNTKIECSACHGTGKSDF